MVDARLDHSVTNCLNHTNRSHENSRTQLSHPPGYRPVLSTSDPFNVSVLSVPVSRWDPSTSFYPVLLGQLWFRRSTNHGICGSIPISPVTCQSACGQDTELQVAPCDSGSFAIGVWKWVNFLHLSYSMSVSLTLGRQLLFCSN